MPFNILLLLLAIVLLVVLGMVLAFVWAALTAPIRVRLNHWQSANSRFEPCENSELAPQVASIIANLSDLGFSFRGHWHAPDQSPASGQIALLEHPRTLDVAKVIIAGVSSYRQVTVAFQTRYEDSTEIVTANNRNPSGLPSPPEITPVWLPDVRDVRQLYRIHTQLRESLDHGKKRLSVGQDPVAYLAQGRDWLLSHWVATGHRYLDETHAVYRPTWKGAVLLTWRHLPQVLPLYRMWRRRPTNKLLRERGIHLKADLVQKETTGSTVQDLGESMARYEITQLGKTGKEWTLWLFPDYLQLENAEGELFEVDRSERRGRAQVIEGNLFLPPSLVVTIAKKKFFFRLPPEAFAAVREWIGPPTLADLKHELKKHLGWLLPLGFLFAVAALPLGKFPGDPISLGLGLLLLVTAVIPKLWPHRIFFALESLWFSFLAANSIWLLVHQWSWLRLVFLLVQLTFVRSGWRQHRRFAPVRMQLEEEAA